MVDFFRELKIQDALYSRALINGVTEPVPWSRDYYHQWQLNGMPAIFAVGRICWAATIGVKLKAFKKGFAILLQVRLGMNMSVF